MAKDIKIFVSHRIDLDSKVIENEIFFPVRCGAVFDKRPDVSIVGDNTGDNISERRETFCELTVMYWAWKNVEADYYGLCHYRRYMSFRDDILPEDIYGNVCCDYLNDRAVSFYGLDNVSHIHDILSQYDFVYTDFDVSNDGFKNVYKQFSVLPTLDVKNLDVALDVLKEKYPQFMPYAKKYFEGKHLYPCLMFVMKRDIFNEWCEWIFDILFTLEKRMNITNYCLESQRTIAHIAERFFGVFITYLMETHQYKYKCMQRVMFFNTDDLKVLKPYYKQRNVPIVFASSDYFIPYLSITLESLLEKSSTEYNYDVIVLNTGIAKKMRNRLLMATSKYPNCHICFHDISSLINDVIKGLELRIHAHFARETFYRLLAPELFSNYDKVIYLDSDLVVCDDISKLYEIDLGENLVAAVTDADFAGEYSREDSYIKKYCDEKLKLKNVYEYFQAGVMVFNICQMKKRFKPRELISIANSNEFIFVDQDVLNKDCQGRAKKIDMSWNVLHDCGEMRVGQFITRAPARIYKEYLEARKHPKIIHYAGFEKPWDNPECDFAEVFWERARKSCFYEIILRRMMLSTSGILNIHRLSFARRYADKFFPKGTRRREMLKRIIPRGSWQFNFLKRVYHFFALD